MSLQPSLSTIPVVWRETWPYGGVGGRPFYDDFVSMVRLAGLVIRHEQYIEGIQGIYQDYAGNLINGPWHGGFGGTRDVIMFERDEMVQNIYGRSGWFVDQLAFETNKRMCGPFGGAGGEAWQIGPGQYRLGGLFGRAGVYVDRIGFFYAV